MLLVTGQERGGTALFANGVGLSRPVEQDPDWAWRLVPLVMTGDEQTTRAALRTTTPGRALKCPSWVFVANAVGRDRFEAIVFLQRDIRDQVASLVDMMAGTTRVDWERPASVWRGLHGEWVRRIAPRLGVDLSRPVDALADLWCAYARAGRGLHWVQYERMVADPQYFARHLSKLGVSASERQVASLLATHAHGPEQVVRGVGRWRADLPAEVAGQLVERRDATMRCG